MPKEPFRINTKPGIRRDVLLLDNDFYTDGVWCRFLNQRPKKIGGYTQLYAHPVGVGQTTGLHSTSKSGYVYTHVGHTDALVQGVTTRLGSFSALNDRTPTSDFVDHAANLWTFDVFSDLAGTGLYLLAHPGQNLVDIDSSVETNTFFGEVTGTGVLTAIQHAATTDIVCSGGIIAAQPYVFVFGNDGIIKNCKANDLTDWVATGASDANEVRAAKTKIIAAKQLTGGGGSPAVLFWSLDSVIRASFVGGGQVFRYDTIASETSILSSRSVVEFNGQFFWPGVDQFNVTNGGSVQKLENPFNSEWFFKNLNWEHRQKVFGLAVRRYNELWWFFPKGASTECNHAIIFNTAERVWYDTPAEPRSCGVGAGVFMNPILADDRDVWMHEKGVDRVTSAGAHAIMSSFTTNEIGLMSGGPSGDTAKGIDRWTELDRLAPEFDQVGDLQLEYLEQEHAKADIVTRGPFTITPTTAFVDETIAARLLRLRVTSNEAGGDYHMGSVFAHIAVGDE